MIKNGLIAVLIIAVVVLAAVAFTQFNAQQDATAQVRDAETARARLESEQATSAARADSALLAQQTAEAGQAAAAALATGAALAQVEAEAALETAAAAADARAASQHDLTTARAQMTAQATAQAASAAQLATAQTLIAAQATDIFSVSSALGTATAQVDLADFARFAAEEDRAAALTQAYAAATALARLEATLASGQSIAAAPTRPSATPSPAAPTDTPPTATAGTSPAMPTIAAAGTLVTVGEVALNQVFTSPDGFVSLNYPDGWLVQDVDGQIVMVNTADALSGSGNSVQPGHFVASIVFGPAIQLPGVTAESDAVEFLAALRQVVNARAEADSQLSEPAALSVGSFDAARADVTNASGQTLVIALRLGDGNFAVGFGNSAPGELDQYEPVFRAILSTLRYTP